MKKSLLNLTIIVFIISSCKTQRGLESWKLLDLGEFTIEVPENLKFEEVPHIDSYFGKLKTDSFQLMFDYGLYAPKMILTEKEFIDSEEWKYGELIIILEPLPIVKEIAKLDDSTYKVTYDFSECLKNDSCIYHKMQEEFNKMYIMNLQDSVLLDTFQLPEKMKNYEFSLFENDSIYKKVFLANDLNKLKSGVYILNKNSCEDRFNCWEQLSMWTSDSVLIDKEKLFRIFKSVKMK